MKTLRFILWLLFGSHGMWYHEGMWHEIPYDDCIENRYTTRELYERETDA